MTAMYSILHMFVDGVCAFAMFGTFLGREQGYGYVLLYNFCAFALQMPLGAVLDLLDGKNRKGIPFAAAGLGVILTLAGAFTHPAVLGLGNALFHIGGGVGTICEDERKGWRGRGLGVFVAPGAFGLYLGMSLAGNGAGGGWLCGAGIFMAIACLGMAWRLRQNNSRVKPADKLAGGIALAKTADYSVSDGRRNRQADVQAESVQGTGMGEIVLLAFCALLVVILRSYIGMAVTFPWKTTAFAAVVSTLAIVLGKAAGGFLAAQYGFRRTVVVSLSAAAVCYLFSGFMPAGAAALFFFNMTMPVTLYLLIRSLPQCPGFSFGFLTFGLFLGFLPTYFGLRISQNSSMIGCVGSVISLLVLAAGITCFWNREPAGQSSASG